MSFLESYEPYIYNGLYFSMLAIMPLLEILLPLRTNKYPIGMRWLSNFLLGISYSIIERFILPLTAIAFAIYVHNQGWGLFNIVAVPGSIAVVLSILIYDFSKYALHLLYHHVPLFWAFHKIHHSDPDYDFTTSFRFHPLEPFIGALAAFALIFLLGVPVIAIIIYQFLLICVNFFVHTNVKLPKSLEKFLRLFFVTPDMHRIHHSAYEPHTNSNYSIVFPYWDYLGRSYTPVDAVDQENMPIGLLDCQGEKHRNIFWLLALPFIPEKKEQT